MFVRDQIMKEFIVIFIFYVSLSEVSFAYLLRESCPSACTWLSWKSWGTCSKSCGGGVQTRTRSACCRSDATFDQCMSECHMRSSDSTDEQCCNTQCYHGASWTYTDRSSCTGKCTCTKGYRGDCCNTACPNIAHCEAGEVECDFLSTRCTKCTPPYISTDWSGTCRDPVCTPSCQNNGTCISDDVCDCKAGYIGERCSLGGSIDSYLLPTLKAVDTSPFQPLSWYDNPDFSEFGRICYAKIGIMDSPLETLITAESLTSANVSFGTFTTGPLDSSGGLNGTQRVACVQIRCPSSANNGNNRNIIVRVYPTTGNGQCLIGSGNKLMNVTVNHNTGKHDTITFKTEYGINYGPSYGVYVGIGSRDKAMFTARQQCLSDAILAVTSYARYFEINWRNTTDIKRFPNQVEYKYKCAVNVRVCETAKCKKIYPNATVYVLTRNGTDEYMGYDHDETDSNGRACVLTACDHNAYVFARSQPDNVRNYELLFTTNASQTLPGGYSFSISQMNQLIDFRVINRGTVTIQGQQKTGPVYDAVEECTNAKSDDFSFDYSFLAQQENLQTNIPINTHQNELSWYYVDPRKITYESCFLKIRIKSRSWRQSVATAVSTDGTSGNWYGTYTVGAQASPSASDQDVKTACVEYRCPVHDERGRLKDTMVTGSVSDSGTRTSSCKVTGAYGIGETIGNATHFSVKVHADENYGSYYGVYKHRDREIGKAMCLTGQSFLFPSFNMNPQSHNFASFDCTSVDGVVGK